MVATEPRAARRTNRTPEIGRQAPRLLWAYTAAHTVPTVSTSIKALVTDTCPDRTVSSRSRAVAPVHRSVPATNGTTDAHSDDGDPLARVHGDPPFRGGDRGGWCERHHWA